MSKEIFQINMAATVPTILIHGSIGQGDKVDCTAYKNALAEIKKTSKKAHLDIHSGGGNMADGFAMMDATVNSGLEVSAHVSGIVGSMAGVLLLAIPKERVTVSQFAQMMTHKPSMQVSGEADQIRAIATLADDFEKKVKAAFKARTGLTDAQIEDWFKPGVNNWMNADKMIECNIASKKMSATSAPANFTIPDLANKSDVDAFSLYNEIFIDQNPTNNMLTITNQTLLILKLSATATQTDVDAAVKNLVERNTVLEAEAKTAKEKAETELTNRATKLVKDAVTAKKITAAEEADYIKNAVANYDFVEKVLNGMKGVVSINGKLKDDKVEDATDKSAWKLKDYLEKDYEGLMKMKTEDNAAYTKLFSDAGVPMIQ